MSHIKPPKHLRDRLQQAARDHAFASADAFTQHLLDRGLAALAATTVEEPLAARLERLVEERGYASLEEAVEHLLERGLQAYEQVEEDPEVFKARLRGLGYIE